MCPRGTYQTNNDTCAVCPGNSTTASSGSSSRLQCVCYAGFVSRITLTGGDCYQCPLTTYMSGGGCVPCPTGTMTDGVGSLSIASCKAVAGYYAKYTETFYAVVKVPSEQYVNDATFISVMQQAAGPGSKVTINRN
jgi:hypothetical protein